MQRLLFPSASIVLALALALATHARGQTEPPDQLPPLPAEASDPDLDVLTRGPVHEAFAEQTSPNPEPGITAPHAPPDAVNEIPPDLRPEGDDVAWIPGYWFWDDDRNDYVWVSGVWRRLPPGRRWVPGYWQQNADSYQWIAGFWSPDTADAVEYLETPPESLETGPSSPAPSDDYFWTPGVWSWNTGTYLWQPGYWNTYRDGWTWVSARYVWTPHGCVYIPGYWDFSLTLRGHLFAPVYYRTPIYRRAGYFFRPVCWIGYEPLLLHLFVRPRSHHLYFGDYYDPLYRQRHFIPCHAFHSRHFGYASLYVYYQHHYRKHGIDYVGRVGQWHNYYAKNVQRRPPHTYGLQVRRPLTTLTSEKNLNQDILARPYARRTSDRIAGRELVRVPTEHQQKIRRDSEQVIELAKTRQRFEVSNRTTQRDKTGRDRHTLAAQDRLKLPLASSSTSQLTTATATGSRHRIPSDIARINRGAIRSDLPTIRGQDADLGGKTTRPRTPSRDNPTDQLRDGNALGKLRDLNTNRGQDADLGGKTTRPRTPSRDNPTDQLRDGSALGKLRDLNTNRGDTTRSSTPSETLNRRQRDAALQLGTQPAKELVPRSSPSDTIRLPLSRGRTTLPLASDPSGQSGASGSPTIMRRPSSGNGSAAHGSHGSSSSAGAWNGGALRARASQGLREPAAGFSPERQRSTIETAPRANKSTTPPPKFRLPEVKTPTTQHNSQSSSGQSLRSPWSRSSRVEAPRKSAESIRLPTSQSFSSRAKIDVPAGPPSTLRRSAGEASSSARLSSGSGGERGASSIRSFRGGGRSAEGGSGSSGNSSGGRGRGSSGRGG